MQFRKTHLLAFIAALALVLTASVGVLPSEAGESSVGIREAADRPVAEGADLFSFLDTTSRLPLAGWRAIPDAVEEFHIRPRPALVAANPERLIFELPFGRRVEAVRTDFADYGPEWKSWFGTLRPLGLTEEGEGFAYLGYHGEQLTAVLHFDGERYQITGGVGGRPHRLVRQADELATVACGLDHLHEELAAQNVRPPSLPESAATEAGPSVDSATGLSHTITYVDVLAIYPKAYFSFPLSEVSLHNFVEDSIALANSVFVNNGMNFRYRLRSVNPIIGSDQPSYGGGLGTALDWLNGEPTEVQNLRNAFTADVVSIFIPSSWSTGDPVSACGLSNLAAETSGGSPLIYEGFNSSPVSANMLTVKRAFNSNKQSCGLNDYTLGHEIGHDYGMWHDTSRSNLLETYARGFKFTTTGGDPKATIMGCNCVSGCTAGVSAVCNRIAYFSDPGETFGGVTIGNSTTADNATLGNARIGSYAAFRTATSNTPPVASFTISCTGRTCTFDASGSTDNGTIDEYYWDFGNGVTRTTTSSSTVYTYPGSGTSYWVHLLATDNGDQRDLSIDLVSL